MGYQALLFCPDEKLARVVSQVFGELEFAVEPVSEPFVVVKKMMAQHYDAIVVDSADEQNASLLFKSARNSSFNQGSLAIALVEGQAGVAKAYRIGANLVLTKPINVEQAKGTLRVARGLLRKTFDAGTAASHAAPAAASHATPAESATAAPAPAAPTPAAWPVQPANRIAESMVSAASHAEAAATESPIPAMAASAEAEEKPAAVPPPAAVASTPIVAQSRAESAPAAAKLVSQEPAKTDAAKPPTVAAPVPSATSTSQGAAAAPAPAKEVTAPASREVKEVKNQEVKPKTEAETPKNEKVAEIAPGVPQAAASTSTSSYSDGPSFAALDVEDAGASATTKKLFIVAVAVLALAAAGYFGWAKFGAAHSNRVQPTTPAPQQKTAPGFAPTSFSAPSPSDGTISRVSVATPAIGPKASTSQTGPSAAGASPITQIAVTPEPEVKNTASAPIRVKSAPAGAKGQTPIEDTSSQPPSPLTVASAGDTGLSGLVASPASGTQPVLARIKVSQGVSQGLLIKRVQPKYPSNALAARAQGAVQIEATVNKEGKVVNPKVLSGDPMLAAAALEAVRQWRYKPYYLDGEPVEIQTQITINFKLN